MIRMMRQRRSGLEPREGTLAPDWGAPFARPIGLDFIITDTKKLVLLELQYGFGRLGFRTLYPQEYARYRRAYWELRRTHGKNRAINEGLRRLCGNKATTYRYLKEYQPSSFLLRRPGTPALRRWLKGLQSDLVLAKPPIGSCGRGILVFRREDLLAGQALQVGQAVLLQEFVRSRLHYLERTGDWHVGCVRHIMFLVGNGDDLGFIHFPSYWRVAPFPYNPLGGSEELTSNISRGAIPLPLEADEELAVGTRSEEVGRRAMEVVLSRPEMRRKVAVTLGLDRKGEMGP